MSDETRQDDRAPVVTGPATTTEQDALLDTIDTADATGTQGDNDLSRAAARRIRAVRLRIDGATYDQIARICGYSDKKAAWDAVHRALARTEVENVTELRQIENMRLDSDERVLRAIIADSGAKPETRIRAIDSRLRLSARRGRLNGTDAPVQVALSAGVASDLADAIREAEEVLTGFVPGEVVSSVDDEPLREEA